MIFIWRINVGKPFGDGNDWFEGFVGGFWVCNVLWVLIWVVIKIAG